MVEPGNTDVAEDPQLQSRLAKLLTVGEECQTVPELTRLLQAKGSEGQPRFNLYDGFEPSGRMHIAQGIFKAINVNKCTDTGGHFIFWVADWFGLMNDKMGGDMEKIQVVGKYLIEVWKAAGMNMEHVEFRWCEEAINNEAEAYWGQCLDIARRFTVSRIKKCCTIMGRGEGGLSAAQILYPIMQCTDIFFSEGRHLPAGRGPEKGQHVGTRVLRCSRIEEEACDFVTSHAVRLARGSGQDVEVRPGQCSLHGRYA
mmetsp:Transcript_44138/g.99510  ORF Transcript_44138/g.99510 Transcript_44138/m.99510 type:complete len:256 (+) Transcript_44138:111-878(+)